MSKTIPLTAGRVAVVDDADYEWLSRWKWWFSPGVKIKDEGYAARKTTMVNGKRTTIAMHRQIMGAKPGEQVDHVNGDKLDNRRANLRPATRSQNGSNRIKFRGRKEGGAYTSRFKGVSWNRRYGKWYAHIGINRKRFHLGRFDDEIEAAKAYDAKAIELHGKYALLNFPRSAEREALPSA